MSFAKPLIEDLKGKGLKIFVSGNYGRFEQGFGDKVPEDTLSGSCKCVGVYVAVKQSALGTDPDHNRVAYSVRPDMSVNVVKISPGAEGTITSYLKSLGYKEVTFG